MINKEKSDNFYITLNANQTQSLLYSGKFKIFENIKFVDLKQSVVPIASTETTTTTTSTGTTTQVENTPPPQFDANGIPILNPNSRGQLDYYRNLVIYTKANLTTQQLTELQLEINVIGTITYYRNGVFVVERVRVEDIEILKRESKIDVIYQMKLDFGWTKKSNANNLQIIQNTSTETLDNNSFTE